MHHPGVQSKRPAWAAPHVSPAAAAHLLLTVIPHDNTHTHTQCTTLSEVFTSWRPSCMFRIWHWIILTPRTNGIRTHTSLDADRNRMCNACISQPVVFRVHNRRIQAHCCLYTLITVTCENASNCCKHTHCICSSRNVYLHWLSITLWGRMV